MTAPRRLYGVVYELILTDTPPDICEYIGRTRDLRRRMATTGSGHRSPTSIARDPWKARIRPGAAGYRILHRVYSTGDERVDAELLKIAESDLIDKRNAKRNDVRPVRPRVHEARRRPARQPIRRTAAQSRAAARAKRRLIALAFLAVLFAIPVGNVAAAMPQPEAPWVAVPTVAPVLAWLTMWWCIRTARRLSRGFR